MKPYLSYISYLIQLQRTVHVGPDKVTYTFIQSEVRVRILQYKPRLHGHQRVQNNIKS